MISAIAPDPIASSLSNAASYRPAPVAATQRTILPTAAPAAPAAAGPNHDGRYAQPQRAPAPEAELIEKDSSSMFAAAVIAGALAPTPRTMEEVIQRIGLSTIPPESEARLKDLIA